MRFGNFIFGVALLLVAATLALTITFRNAPAPQTSSGTPSAEGTRGSAAPSRGSSSTASPTSGKRNTPRPPRHQEPGAEDMDIALDDSPSAPKLSPAERQAVAARAPGVKRAALAKLGKMTERFDLTRDQRRKIFPLLVESTNGYHPAMVVTVPSGGTAVPVEVADTGKTADEAIHDALDPDQQEDFVEARIDEIAWWDEIVSQLEEDFDSAVAAGTAPPSDGKDEGAETDQEPTDDSTQQGSNLFDLLNQ